MRAECNCGSSIQTLRLRLYREWRDCHPCSEPAEAFPSVYDRGSASVELSSQWNGDFDSGYRTNPGVNARKIGFQAE